MTELFTRYGPGPSPKGKEPPRCAASYPSPCGEPAVGEGWGCLPFCERHWREAEMAAREELVETVENELDVLADAEDHRFDANAALVRALKNAGVPGLVWEVADYDRYREALTAAYPAAELEANTDPDTLRYDYRRFDGDGPIDWWADARVLVLRFMRQASEKGVPDLMLDLERLREKATVQGVLAERDYERRWASLPKAEREALIRASREEDADA